MKYEMKNIPEIFDEISNQWRLSVLFPKNLRENVGEKNIHIKKYQKEKNNNNKKNKLSLLAILDSFYLF